MAKEKVDTGLSHSHIKTKTVKKKLSKLKEINLTKDVSKLPNSVQDKFEKNAMDKKNELYIKLNGFKEDESVMVDHVKSLHKNIIDVRLARRPKKMKIAWAVFESEEAATAALPAMRKNQFGYFVGLPSNNTMKISQVKSRVKTKTHQRNLQKLWNDPNKK